MTMLFDLVNLDAANSKTRSTSPCTLDAYEKTWYFLEDSRELDRDKLTARRMLCRLGCPDRNNRVENAGPNPVHSSC